MIVYTGGTFDVPHVGHVNFFRQCKEFFPDSWLVVSVNTDEFIYTYKGRKPLFNYAERVKILETIEYINEIVPNIGGEDSKQAILKSQARVVLIGNDWLERDYCKQMMFNAQWLTDNGVALVYLPHTDGISTTEIKERILNAD
jgi:glycerol-3-phosphate cytidylyltransferase